MATPMTADRFLQILRDEGLTVVEVGDWETHNRNHMGPWGPVHGVMIHHTVTSGSAHTVTLCRDGHSLLPGPLCHGVITKDGRVHLVGYGRANHAGLGDGDVLAAVIDERQLPADDEATTDGNRHFYGFECENLGTGEDPWPDAQLEAIERASAAICRHHGWSARSVIGHLEWQPGKVDPRGFTMASMRARVDERLQHPAGWQPTTPTPTPVEDDMQLSDQVTVAQWVKDRWPDDAGLADGEISVNTALGSGYAYSRTAATLARAAADNSIKILTQLAAQQATIAELTATVARLAANAEAIDADALVARVTAAIETVTISLDATPE